MREQLSKSPSVVVREKLGKSEKRGGVPAETRTRNLLLRRQLLCPIELQGRTGHSFPEPHTTHTAFLRVHFNTSLMPQQVHGTSGSEAVSVGLLTTSLEER